MENVNFYFYLDVTPFKITDMEACFLLSLVAEKPVKAMIRLKKEAIKHGSIIFALPNNRNLLAKHEPLE